MLVAVVNPSVRIRPASPADENEAMTENIDYYPRRGFVETHRATDAGYYRVYVTRPVPGTQ